MTLRGAAASVRIHSDLLALVRRAGDKIDLYKANSSTFDNFATSGPNKNNLQHELFITILRTKL